MSDISDDVCPADIHGKLRRLEKKTRKKEGSCRRNLSQLARGRVICEKTARSGNLARESGKTIPASHR